MQSGSGREADGHGLDQPPGFFRLSGKSFPILRVSALTPWISLGPMGVHAGAGQTVGSSGASQCFPLSSPFVPVNLFPGLKAMQSLGILSIQSGSLHATGSGKLITPVERANRKGNNCRGNNYLCLRLSFALDNLNHSRSHLNPAQLQVLLPPSHWSCFFLMYLLSSFPTGLQGLSEGFPGL